MSDCSSVRAVARLLLIAAAGALVACRAKEAEFYAKPFTCDPSATQAKCGTTQAGKPMSCFRARVIGGDDFCAESCDPREIPPAGFVCRDGGAGGQLLQTCSFENGEVDLRRPCPPGLTCLRTNLLYEQGLCLMINTCTENAECGHEPDHACAGALIRDLVSPAATTLPIKTDHLHCVQEHCQSNGSTCGEDQACLRDVYDPGSKLPDICVPKCADGACPPGYSCARKPASSPGSPAVCIPGLPGMTCDENEDCLAGQCLATGAGFSICTFDCAFPGCPALDGPGDLFVCAEGVPGKPICITPRAYSGGNCSSDDDCVTGQTCFRYGAFTRVPDHGECRVPCPDGSCAPAGGVPYVCLGEHHEGGCHPTFFSLPCNVESDCFEGLECLDAGDDPRSLTNYSEKICSVPCTSDADCDANRLTAGSSFCEVPPEMLEGICRHAGETGAPCTRDAHCASRHCKPDVGCLD